jgi:arabinogalactan oligomer/maltooligosaccharide transport system substrate-binding protein
MLFEAASGAKDAKTAATDAVKAIADEIAQKHSN